MKKLLLVANVSKEHIRKFHIPFILRMKELGWQVDVACKMDAPIPECDHCYNLPCDRNPFVGGIRKSVRILRKIIEKNEYDVIHCNTITGSIVGRIAAKPFRKDGLKVFYTNHGLHFYKGASIGRWLLGYPMEKILAPFTDTFITINEADYVLAKKYLAACGSIERIHGIGVKLSRFRESICLEDRKKMRRTLGIAENDYVLTYVAEINSNKNQISLLEAFYIVHQVIPFSKLLLIGPDHTDGHFQKYVFEKGLAEHVLLLGWRDDIPRLLNSSDVYVASSKSEGLGLNLIEAMACNLPVVAFKNRGHCEVICHNKNGFLIEQNDYEEMAKYIIVLHKNQKIRNRITAQAQEDICKYEIRNVLKELELIYNKMNERDSNSKRNDKDIIFNP